MKYLFPIIILLSMGWTSDSSFSFFEKMKLEPCPNSPNCVSTQETRRRKRMRPIPFERSLDFSKKKLKVLLEVMIKNIDATLIEEDGNYLHYEFKTKIGDFTDDVEFIFDEKNKQIHFRSASRKGYGDFGKNRRRMKNIRRKFKHIIFYD